MIMSCQNSKKAGHLSSNQYEADSILYDTYVGELVHETEDSVWYEPYEKKVLKNRDIFKKGKKYIYQAIYKSEEGVILSISSIELIPSGERIEFAPLTQDKVTFKFMNYLNDKSNLKNHIINKELNYWTGHTFEGVIENKEKVWMHPFRSNQYKFTEVAPFPSVELPLEVGNEWESNLTIGQGWGEWSNTSGYNYYKVIGKSEFSFGQNKIECWEIKSNSEFPFGNSKHVFKFNEQFGFVEMNYVNYENEELNIKMTEVKYDI